MSGFNCNNEELDSRYFKEAWVPSVTICDQGLFQVVENLPVVTGLTAVSAGIKVKLSWDLNTRYKKSIDYKVNSGSWVNLGVYSFTDHSAEIDGYTLTFSVADVISVRIRHYQELNDKTIYSYYSDVVEVTLSQFKIFTGTGTLGSITRSGTATWTRSGNFLLVNNPRNVVGITASSVGLVGSWDLSECTNLTNFTNINETITSVNAKNCTNLTSMTVTGSDLETIDISGCTDLDQLVLSDNLLTHLEISSSTLNYLSVSNNSNLEYIVASGLNGDGGKAMLSIDYCGLSAQALDTFMSSLGVNESSKNLLTITGNPGSKTSNISIATSKGWTIEGGPTKIFSGTSRPNIDAIRAGITTNDDDLAAFATYGTNSVYVDNFNYLLDLDLTNQDIPGEFYLSSSNISSLNFQDTNLTYLDAYETSGLSSVNFAGCSDLVTLRLYSCIDLEELDLSDCSSLETLRIDLDENLETIVFPTDNHLITIVGEQTGIDHAITLTNVDTLTTVSFTNSVDIPSISITGCATLEEVDANGCSSLSAITLSDNPDLTTVRVNNCNLSNTTLNTLFGQLPTLSGQIYIVGNPGTGTCTQTIATNKGWTVND